MWNLVVLCCRMLQAIKVVKIGNHARVSHLLNLFAGLVRGIFDAPYSQHLKKSRSPQRASSMVHPRQSDYHPCGK